MQFMRYVIVWLLRIVCPQYPKKPLKLPLPEQQLEAFKCLPEYFLEDIVDNFKFITRMMPQIATSTQCEELIMICLTFLRSSAYIKNPYLKSGLVTILYYGTLPFYGKSKGVLGDLLFATKFATDNLLHALMQFYIECESTGAHTQFYDKFNIRYEIFQIIKCVWGNPVYRDHLETEAKYVSTSPQRECLTNSMPGLTLISSSDSSTYFSTTSRSSLMSRSRPSLRYTTLLRSFVIPTPPWTKP